MINQKIYIVVILYIILPKGENLKGGIENAKC